MIKVINVKSCRVKTKKGKCWYAKLWWLDEKGKQYQKMKSTGIPIKGNNIRKADEEVAKIASEFEELLNKKKTDEGRVIFSDYMYEWLDVCKYKVRRSTYDSYKMSVESSIAPYFRGINVTLEELKPQDIQKYYKSLLDKGLTANTVKHYHSYINSALKLAVKQGLIDYNPLNGVELPKVEKVEKKAFTAEQLEDILNVIHNDPLNTAVYLGLFCGLRRSEVLGLTWDMVDFENETIHICQTVTGTKELFFEKKTKSKTSDRFLPINEVILNILLEEKKRQEQNSEFFGDTYIENDFVCKWDNGKPFLPGYVSHHFKLVLKKIGINDEDLTFHSLRHTCGSLLSNSGKVSIKTVQSFLGHSDLATTSIYLHPDMKAKQQAADVLSESV